MNCTYAFKGMTIFDYAGQIDKDLSNSLSARLIKLRRAEENDDSKMLDIIQNYAFFSQNKDKKSIAHVNKASFEFFNASSDEKTTAVQAISSIRETPKLTS